MRCPTHHLGAQPSSCDLCLIDNMQGAVEMLAADNCRLINITLAADALAAAAECLREAAARDVQVMWRLKILVDALDKFNVARSGQ